MTGRPTLLVELETPGGWVDVSAFVDLRSGWSLDYGRRDEFASVDPGQLRLTLNNRDGRFTEGAPGYGIAGDQRLRLTETVGATTSRRHTGYVQEWPTEFTDPGARVVPSSITVIDRQSRLARRELPAGLAAEQLADGPVFLYSLGEPAGSTAAGDTSGNTLPSLVSSKLSGGNNTAVVFGVDVGLDQTGVAMPNALGRVLGGTPTVGVLQMTWEVGFVATEVAAFSSLVGWSDGRSLLEGAAQRVSVYLLAPDANGDVQVQVGMTGLAGTVTSTTPGGYADGVPHLVAVRLQGTAIGSPVAVLVDGVVVGSSALTSVPYPQERVTVYGGEADGVFGLAAYALPLSNARLTSHFAALGVTAVESSDARVARLAAYGRLTAADLALEAGVQRSMARQSVAGVGLWSALEDVAMTEGGTVFVDGDGRVVFHNRQHRVLAATSAPAAAFTSDDFDHEGLRIAADKQYLRNEVTGTRTDGGTQTAADTASIERFEEYPSSVELLVTTDDEVRDRIRWEAGAYAWPKPRLPQVTADLLTLPEATVRKFLALRIGDRITISGLPAQSPIAVADLIVEGISERQSTSEWRMTLNTAPAALFRAWRLGDATHGVLGSTTRLHY